MGKQQTVRQRQAFLKKTGDRRVRVWVWTMKITAMTGRRADVMSVLLRAVVGICDILVRDPDPTLFFGDLKDARKKNFQYFFLLTYLQAHKSPVLIRIRSQIRIRTSALTNVSGSWSWKPKNMRIRIPITGFREKVIPSRGRERKKEEQHMRQK
jgi:hypothetical protein